MDDKGKRIFVALLMAILLGTALCGCGGGGGGSAGNGTLTGSGK